jgi:uncharacterized repeat protein (TIGR01451 family)
MKTWFKPIGLAMALLVTGTGVIRAQDDTASRALEVTAENLMAGDARHREIAEMGGDPQTLLAGDVIRYRLRFTNLTSGPVRDVVFHNPVADGLRFVGGSAGSDRQDVVIEYSIDGGRSYAAQPMIVDEVDGQSVERPAPPERYTHVRWTIQGWVDPGAQVTAEFEARLENEARVQQNH